MYLSKRIGLISMINVIGVFTDVTFPFQSAPGHLSSSSPRPDLLESQESTVTIHDPQKHFTRGDLPTTSRWPFSPLELGLPKGWTAYPFQEIQAILPIQLAAAALEEMYYKVFEEATADFWGPGFVSPDDAFILRLGILELSFTVVFGSPPLPFHIISSFAFSMLEATQRGYTSGYTGWIRSPSGSIYRITLKVQPN